MHRSPGHLDRQRPRLTRWRTWVPTLLAGAVTAAAAGGLALVQPRHHPAAGPAGPGGASETTEPSTPPSLGLGITCPPPMITARGGDPQLTWTGRPGVEVLIDGDLEAELAEGSALTKVTLVVGPPGSDSSAASRSGGALDTLTLPLGDLAGGLRFTPLVIGTYPVWAVIEYRPCSGGEGSGVHPIGRLVVR